MGNVGAAALVKSGIPPGGLKNAIQVPALLVKRHISREWMADASFAVVALTAQMVLLIE
jgi:hypothetical protein